MADYNVTCPDYRFCEVKHRYSNPCEIWDCDACWWNHDNCTKTPEAPTDFCPYIKKCWNLPRPSHSHTVTTVISVVSVISVLALVARYMYRRYRRSQESLAERQEEEEEEERIPLLQRCRHLLSRRNNADEDGRSGFDRFRAVIFGHRANPGPPEVPQLDNQPRQDAQVAHGEDHQPSAPPAAAAPPPYEDINRDPIIRGGSLANENFREQQEASVEMREMRSNSPLRSVHCLDEVPLAN